MLAFMIFDAGLWTMADDELRARMGELLDQPDPLIAAYRRANPDDSPASLYIALVSDALMRFPLSFSEAQIEAEGAPTFQYRFTHRIPDPEGRVRSMHGSDMPFFFDNVDKAPLADGPFAESLTRIASRSLIAFATTGSPANDAVPEWPPYTLEEKSTMRLDREPELETDPCGAERSAWEGISAPVLRG
jgi:para-nitrobenzyl esterase